MGVFPIDWQPSRSDGVAFLRLASDRFDRRAKKHEKGEYKIVLRCRLRPRSFFS